ncbi:hypothetical protein K439DRAFT_1285717, partial [Ramaria rubella]
AWIKYMTVEWIPHKECWAHAWHEVHSLAFLCHSHWGIDMNNYIESWHSNLKWNYLRNIWRQHIDYLIRILAEDVEADYMHAHVQIGMGF